MNVPKPVRFQMIGGFLGAGKTTAISKIARHYLDQGQRVGIVTNDQAEDLVDTGRLQSQGFDVGEVAGACFCCNFDDLVSTMRSFAMSDVPDVIVAEPVGSCTDLVATVSEPIRRFYDGEFMVSPYAVLLKPEHGLKILRGEGGGFSPQAEYIFLKQLEEAAIIVINKIDKLTTERLAELRHTVDERFPGKPVIATSAKTGQGIDQLIEALEVASEPVHEFIDIDYDVYAEGEAELGWLNATFAIEAARLLDLNQFVQEFVTDLGHRIDESGAEIAHLKVLARHPQGSAVANLVSSDGNTELSMSSASKAGNFQLVVNARIAMDPDQLAALVAESVASVTSDLDCTFERTALEALRPGRPVPTHSLR